MNKPVYLGLLISDLSKTVMYEFWYDLNIVKMKNVCYGIHTALLSM